MDFLFHMQFTKTLSTYVCGSSGPLDGFNPFLVIKQKWAPELLCALNEHPLSLGEISSALKMDRKEASKLLVDLTRIRAVREESGIYSVTFSIFTREDLSILKRATRPIAREISRSISDHRGEIDSLVENFSSFGQVEKDKLLFATLGCFVLDWLGLKTLEDEGVLVKSKPQPGNRNYLLFAREQVKPNDAEKLYGKMYWGSNTDETDQWVFTSFGDFTGVRYAFPDIIWSLGALPKKDQKLNKSPSWMGEKMSNVIGLTSKRLLKDIGLMLSRLNSEGPASKATHEKNSGVTEMSDMTGLLEDMNYITREKGVFKLNYPVFAGQDSKVIEQLGNLVSPFITEAFHHHYAKLQESLRNTSPMRNKVGFNEVLNDAWHWIFAQTNRILAEKGLLYDPPKRRAGEARYIAWMSEFHSHFP
jgi:hypothetical protein